MSWAFNVLKENTNKIQFEFTYDTIGVLCQKCGDFHPRDYRWIFLHERHCSRKKKPPMQNGFDPFKSWIVLFEHEQYQQKEQLINNQNFKKPGNKLQLNVLKRELLLTLRNKPRSSFWIFYFLSWVDPLVF